MYAIEVRFKDGLSKPEMLLVKRPQALIGASDYAHVVIDDLSELPYQLKVVRSLGRRFSVKRVGSSSKETDLLEFDGEGTVDAGPVELRIFCLDPDLIIRDEETPDRAGVRILRSASQYATPDFPALVVGGGEAMIVSFPEKQSVLIGRKNECAVRLDLTDISGRHARVGYEDGQFWVEDLGSTNGTFLKSQQVSGRVSVEDRQPIVLGRETVVYPVSSAEQLELLSKQEEPSEAVSEEPAAEYPCLFSLSETVRPARVVFRPGKICVIGRDPKSDIWIGAPHVSRRHLFIECGENGELTIEDNSTNGTAFDGGLLKKGDRMGVEEPLVLNLGKGVTLAVCFGREDQEKFENEHGSADTFKGGAQKFVGFEDDGSGGSSILGTHMVNTGRLYKRLSFPMKVLVATVCVGFCLAVYVLFQLLLNRPV